MLSIQHLSLLLVSPSSTWYFHIYNMHTNCILSHFDERVRGGRGKLGEVGGVMSIYWSKNSERVLYDDFVMYMY